MSFKLIDLNKKLWTNQNLSKHLVLENRHERQLAAEPELLPGKVRV